MSAESDALVRAYDFAAQRIRDRVARFAVAVWGSSSAFRDADVDRIVAQIVPAVQAGQLQLAAVTDAYVGRMATLAGVSWSAALDRSVVAYRGIPEAVVYRRPAVAVYTALAGGKTYSDAVAEGLHRLSSIVTTDLQQARNRQAARSIQRSGASMYRRVLAGKGDCALCVIASSQLYRKETLMPIHPGCDCGVELHDGDPNFEAGALVRMESVHADIEARLGGSDRGARDLGIDKRDAQGRSISDYTDLIVTHEHGELGPTIAWRSQKFTSAADIAALH